MNSRKEHLDGLAVGILLVCCMFWGLQQVLVKSIMDEVAPLFQASLRCMGACVLLLVWCRVRGIRLFERDGSLWAGLLAGGLFAAEFACIYLGLRYTTASRLTVFLYTSPFWVAALVPLFVKSERLRPLQWLGMACAFVAVAFAMREGLSAGNNSALGDLLGLAAGALWGLTTVAIRANNLTRISPEKLLFYQIAATALAVPWLSVALGESWNLQWSPMAWGSMLAQTVIGAFASYLAWMWMLGRYPATKISVFVFLTPLFALLFGTLWLGESATPTLLMALGLVAVGIVLVNRK
ncbi:EamA family transporter [Limnohabitans sp. MMS-10A-160]|uniref:DMT family transporter n=1 Tax=unclassified Limnohabitans TaxID=2626134 RepID=UPI000D3AD1E3|nr:MULTISPECIES: DMT family transporter [unclassified Limnohabitans]PUE20832.1 EamA family transporter [Limnohabitans sp. MMS-10A-192]PUE25229.1 EamA family transporter [Limnohabitans sp. MMS-10A-160]